MNLPPLTIIIPTLNESGSLPGLLADLQDVAVAHEVVIADGASDDDTVAVARAAGARTLVAPRGRASQMNAAAALQTGEWLCFVHADVRMPPPARRELERVVRAAHADAAVWRLAIDGPGIWFRLVELGARLRDGLGGLPYGDQGLLIRRDVFHAVGRFPEIPIMEDVALVRAIRRRTRLERLAAPLVVSSRRWDREGPYRTWFRNIAILTAYLVGVSPQRLANWYRPEPQ